MVNIYCRVELKLRELESKLLLAVAAAARGHNVFLGDIAYLCWLAKRSLIAPGLFHTKDLAPEKLKKEWNNLFRTSGFRVTSLDEESGVLGASYHSFGRHRFSEDMIESADRVLCWGPMDYEGLKEMFPEHVDKFVMTGSPRIDLCRPDLAGYFKPSMTDAYTGGKPYFLFASNFASTNGYTPLWKQLEFNRASGRFKGLNDPDEFSVYTLFSRRLTMMGHYVRAIRMLAKTFPDHCIVIRPHPAEASDAWRSYIGDLPNVLEVKELSIAHWIREAKVIFQHGCTTALEAGVVGIPIINFEPSEAPYSSDQVYHPLRVGRKVETVEDLVESVKKVISGEWDGRAEDAQNKEVLRELFHALDGPLASERTVDLWESLPPVESSRETNWTLVRWQIGFWDYVRRPIAAFLRALKLYPSRKNDFSHKFPSLSKRELSDFANRIKSLKKDWKNVRVEKIGRTGVLVRPPNGSGTESNTE